MIQTSEALDPIFGFASHAQRQRYPLRHLAIGVTVAVAYFVGAQIGFALTFPPSTPSVLWPPNAILTVALLLTAPRNWWIYVLAAFPAHLLVEVNFVGLPLALSLFVTNCVESIMAASLVRWLSDAPARFDNLRRMSAFIVGAVIVAPFASSFLDAAVVTSLRPEPYWYVWRTRFFSNVLTELTLVPAAIILITAGPASFRRAVPRRRVEAVLLIVGIVAAMAVSFSDTVSAVWSIPGKAAAPAIVISPFLLWAAARFGLGGASAALLATTSVFIWLGMSGHGPFSMLPPLEGVLAVQIFLTVQAIPLMYLAAIIEGHRQAVATVSDQLRFKMLLTGLSRDFVGVAAREIEERLEPGLAALGEFFQAEHILLSGRAAAHEHATSIKSWSRAGLNTAPDAAWLSAVNGENPLGGAQVMQSDPCLVFHCRAGDLVLGALLVVTDPSRRGAVTGEDTRRLTLVAEIFTNALARKHAEEERERAEHDAQRARDELAHFTRVSAMGQLTASLAHELNQPLTGILGNAQTAQRMLDAVVPDLHELRLILTDIVADDKRAAEMIKRVRGLVRKSPTQMVTLDVNTVIVDVARLLRSDTIMREIRLLLELHQEPLMAHADQVQLRQVLMNLLLNAMDAVATLERGAREVVVRSAISTDASVRVTIQDFGPGLRQNDYARVFDPFYTTKPEGMGMGLSIAKAIVEAHGGRLWADNNTTASGAVFHFVLPLSQPERHDS